VRRVWIDDRNAIFRFGLMSALAESSFPVAGESEEFVPVPELDDVGILVFELERLDRALLLPRPDELRLVAIAAVRHEGPLLQAIEAGVAGVLPRSTLTPAGLRGCLEAVAAGASSMPADLMPRLVSGLARGGRAAVAQSLARREVDVLRLLARGSDTRAIAAELAYSERTVKNIVHDVLVRLDCRTRAQAVGVATRHGVI
jgi:DNA-binding NarL/FixJ family response regulator